MKKWVMASLLALGVTVACQQRASAWSEFKFSAGVSLSWCSTGNCTNWGFYRQCVPNGCPYPVCAPFACAAPAYYGGYAAAPTAPANYGVAAQAPATQAPAANTQVYNAYSNSGYQPVGYYYPGYSTSQVPGYWYGR
jgi:hypothetical protein